jgi:hypothetical protein
VGGSDMQRADEKDVNGRWRFEDIGIGERMF